jgi:hypothetical protein
MTVKQQHDKRKKEKDDANFALGLPPEPTFIEKVKDTISQVAAKIKRDPEAESEPYPKIFQESEQQRLREAAEKKRVAEAEHRQVKPEPEPVRWMELSLAFHGGNDRKARLLAERAITEHHPMVEQEAIQMLAYLDQHNLGR